MINAGSYVKDWMVLIEVTYAWLFEFSAYEWDVEYGRNAGCADGTMESGVATARFADLEDSYLERAVRIKRGSGSKQVDVMVDREGIEPPYSIEALIATASPASIFTRMLAIAKDEDVGITQESPTSIRATALLRQPMHGIHSADISMLINRSSTIYTIDSYEVSYTLDSDSCATLDMRFINPRISA